MSEETQVVALVSRRQVVCGLAALGLLDLAGLTACSLDGESSAAEPAAGIGAAANAAGGTPLAKVSQITVGGGIVVTAPDGRHIVIAQPSAGQFKAYNASCTHQGTTIGAPVKGTMTCPNHGSQFSAADGSVTRGPAAVALKPVAVEVQAGDILLAAGPGAPKPTSQPSPPSTAPSGTPAPAKPTAPATSQSPPYGPGYHDGDDRGGRRGERGGRGHHGGDGGGENDD